MKTLLFFSILLFLLLTFRGLIYYKRYLQIKELSKTYTQYAENSSSHLIYFNTDDIWFLFKKAGIEDNFSYSTRENLNYQYEYSFNLSMDIFQKEYLNAFNLVYLYRKFIKIF